MDSVMDFVNISAIYHATQMRQIPHYQMIKYLKRENVRDVRDKKRKKLLKGVCGNGLPAYYAILDLSIEINVKNIKNDKILREKHCLILGNVQNPIYRNLGNV